jgi:hypothetical protein
MADVTVFVDRAVQGDLPRVCVIDGIDTADSLTVRHEIGDEASLGVAWLLLLAGPLGWIGFLVVASYRSGRSEVLTVRLPYSAAAYARLQAARRQRRIGWGLVAAGAVAGLIVAVAGLWAAFAALVIGAAVAAGAWGGAEVVRSAWRRRGLSVNVELDASRRWVTLYSVHPRFAAALNPIDAVRPTP